MDEVPVSTVVTVKHRFWEDPGTKNRFSELFIAIVRHLKCQWCYISGNQIKHDLAITYFMFAACLPPAELFISRSTLSTGISRRAEQDFQIIQSTIEEGDCYFKVYLRHKNVHVGQRRKFLGVLVVSFLVTTVSYSMPAIWGGLHPPSQGHGGVDRAGEALFF